MDSAFGLILPLLIKKYRYREEIIVIQPKISALSSRCHVLSVSPTIIGKEDWNTIAPVMFDIARWSLPLIIQDIELNFSGSSVAIGESITDIIKGARPIIFDTDSMLVTKKYDDKTIPHKPMPNCENINIFVGSADLQNISGCSSSSSKPSSFLKTMYRYAR